MASLIFELHWACDACGHIHTYIHIVLYESGCTYLKHLKHPIPVYIRYVSCMKVCAEVSSGHRTRYVFVCTRPLIKADRQPCVKLSSACPIQQGECDATQPHAHVTTRTVQLRAEDGFICDSSIDLHIWQALAKSYPLSEQTRITADKRTRHDRAHTDRDSYCSFSGKKEKKRKIKGRRNVKGQESHHGTCVGMTTHYSHVPPPDVTNTSPGSAQRRILLPAFINIQGAVKLPRIWMEQPGRLLSRSSCATNQADGTMLSSTRRTDWSSW